jgi:hypothetical protein
MRNRHEDGGDNGERHAEANQPLSEEVNWTFLAQ